MAETIPGGYTIGADGQPHDANGKPVKKLSDRALAAARSKIASMTPEQIAAAAELRRAEQAQLEADEAAEKAAENAEIAAEQAKAAEKQAKKK